jgi:channel protein (hemolysin III family)
MCDPTTISLSWTREPFNTISHIIGALIFAALAVQLIRRGRGDRLRTLSLAVLAYASIQTLLISSAYHSLWPGAYRDFMLRADVVGIFILIAGSITPVHVILFTGVERWAPLALAWTIAFGGAILRIVYFDTLPGIVGVAIFLAFGWATAVTAATLWWRFGWRFVRFAVLSGLAYTVGAIVLVQHGPIVVKGVVGPHELWHLAVLTGLAMQWAFVFQFADGVAPRQRGMLIPVNDGPLIGVPLEECLIPISTADAVSPLRHSA